MGLNKLLKHLENMSEQVSKMEDALSVYNCAEVNEQAAAAFLSSEKFKSKVEDALQDEKALKECLNAVDLTSLKVTDNEESIVAMVEKVNRGFGKRGNVAAICVYPSFVATVKQNLQAEGVKIAAVSGGFPHSQTMMEVKIAETRLCLLDGADEIDVVLPVGKFLGGDFTGCADEIGELKSCCQDKTLKVILETGVMPSLSMVAEAALLAMEAGADFVKTSTGKEREGATPEAAWAMCKAIRQYFEKSGRKVGFKVAGGVRTQQDAVTYLTIARSVLGEEWVEQGLFRIGATALVDKL